MTGPLRMSVEAKAEHTYVYLVRSSGWQDGFAYVGQYADGKWQSAPERIWRLLGMLVDAGLVDTEEAEGDEKLARFLREERVLPTVKEEKKVKPCPDCGGTGTIHDTEILGDEEGRREEVPTETRCKRCGGCGVVQIEEAGAEVADE